MEEEEAADQNMENTYDEDDEADETLSLSDYSVKTMTAECEENYSMQQQQGTSSSSDQEQYYFEFCNEDWSPTSISNPPEEIIFCGKIITFRERGHKKPAESFRWNGSHNIGTGRKLDELYKKRKDQKLHKFIPVLSSLVKLRWSLFFIGGTRFPAGMALKDIKSRQGRRSPSSTLFGFMGSTDDEKMMIKGQQRRLPKAFKLW